MNDLISRQAAIDAAMQDVSDKRSHDFNAGATRAANRIKLLPTVDAITVEYIHRRIETLNEYISKWGGSFEHEEMVNAYIHEVSALGRLVNDWRKEE